MNTTIIPGSRRVLTAVALLACAAAAGCGGNATGSPSKTTTVTQTVTAPAPAAKPAAAPARAPDCVTGTQTVLVLLYGPRSEQTCQELAYRINHTIGADASPSLDHGAHGSTTVFATDDLGDQVDVIEEGADQGDINTLIAGVLTGLDYTVKPDWRELVLP